jgi:hypothetical protein
MHLESLNSMRADMRAKSSDLVKEIFRNIEIDDQLNEDDQLNDNNSNDNDSKNHDVNAVAEERTFASASRKLERLRKAFKLTEKMIEYDSK